MSEDEELQAAREASRKRLFELGRKTLGDEPTDLGKEEKRLYRSWSAREPAKFSPKHLHSLRKLHEKVTRVLNNRLSTELRGGDVLRVGDPLLPGKEDVRPLQTSFRGYIDSLKLDDHSEGGRVAIVVEMSRIAPQDPTQRVDRDSENLIDKPIVLAYDRGLAFDIIDRVMGGGGLKTSDFSRPQRSLTEIEETALSKFNTMIVLSLQEAWQQIDRFVTMKISDKGGTTGINQLVIPSDVTTEVIFQVRSGGGDERIEGTVSVGFPYTTLYPFLNKLSPEHLSDRITNNDIREAVGEVLDRVPMTLRAEWGRAGISTRKRLNLEIGDVVWLNRTRDEMFLVYIGDYPRYLASLGQWQGRVVMRIEKVLTPEEQDYAARPGGHLPELTISRKGSTVGQKTFVAEKASVAESGVGNIDAT